MRAAGVHGGEALARLFYSMCGHGRGHATRAQAIIEALRGRHTLRLYCPGDAYDFLEPKYRDTSIRIVRLPLCLRMVYRRNRVSAARTAWHAMREFRGLRRTIAWLEAEIVEHRPDLALVDLEPALPRAAWRCGVPYLTVDNQHRFVVERLTGLSPKLYLCSLLTGLFTRWTAPSPAAVILPTFGNFEIRERYRGRTHRVGPLLRESVLSAPTGDDGFLLAYLRDTLPDSVLGALSQSPLPIRAFGLGRRPDRGSLRFEDSGEEEFVRALARCRAVVATAGHQVMSEALYLRKPVFLLPEPGHFEQRMNAHWASLTGIGTWCDPREFSASLLAGFLARLDAYQAPVPAPGHRRIREVLESCIDQSSCLRGSHGDLQHVGS